MRQVLFWSPVGYVQLRGGLAGQAVSARLCILTGGCGGLGSRPNRQVHGLIRPDPLLARTEGLESARERKQSSRGPVEEQSPQCR